MLMILYVGDSFCTFCRRRNVITFGMSREKNQKDFEQLLNVFGAAYLQKQIQNAKQLREQFN